MRKILIKNGKVLESNNQVLAIETSNDNSFALNNPNLPNCYLGMPVNANTKIRLHFPKMCAGLPEEILTTTNIDMYSQSLHIASLHGTVCYSIKIDVGSSVYIELMQIDNYSSSSLSDTIHCNTVEIIDDVQQDETVADIFNRIGTFETTIGSFFTETSIENITQMVTYINTVDLSLRFSRGGGYGKQHNLNEYPADWIEFINE